MGGRKTVYSALAVLLTVISLVIILFLNESFSYEDANNDYNYSGAGFEDSEYLGYIFDDYNEKVNLDYIDKEPVNNSIKGNDMKPLP